MYLLRETLTTKGTEGRKKVKTIMDASRNFTKQASNDSLTNHSFEYGCHGDTEAARITKMFSLSVILVMSLFGNLLVIYVVCRNRNLRRTINYFILNIAVSDVLIPVIVIPMMLVNLARDSPTWLLHGPVGVITCKLVLFLADVSPAVSILSLIFMTLDRFLAVVFPLRVTLMNARRRYFLIALTWIISIGFFSPYFYAIQLLPSYKEGEYRCHLSWSNNLIRHIEIQKAFSIVLSIYFLVIPFAILTVLYSIILIKTKTPDYIRSKCSTAARARQKKTSRRLTIMAFLIVFVFGLCWGPYNIIVFLQIFVWNWKVPSFCGWSSVIFTVQFLSYANAAINPCVYFGFIKNFRRGLVNQFTTRKSSQKEYRRNKLNSETMLCSIQNNTVRNTMVMSGPEYETCL